jgi:hypothetical protein
MFCRNMGNCVPDYTPDPQDNGSGIHQHENIRSNTPNRPFNCWVTGLLQETFMISKMKYADIDTDMKQWKTFVTWMHRTKYSYILTNHIYFRFQCRLQSVLSSGLRLCSGYQPSGGT